ncbi:MAG: helix-turn-helix domain-containing protein [Lachnospiraceae bacterium]|nr:helix-turn-helix domain-containing protein [Lachnospiraceae bacterium]
MISNKVLQKTLEGLSAIARVNFCIMDTEGKTIAQSGGKMYECKAQAHEFARSMADSQEIKGHQYFKIFDDSQVEFVLMVEGAGEDFYTIGKLAAFQVQNLMVAYKERFDKDNFIKNLLLDNLLLIDIYNRSRKLHIKTEVKRIVMIAETEDVREDNTLDSIRTFFAENTRDFVTSVEESNVVIVKDLTNGDQPKDIESTARALEDYLKKEGFTGILISYGTLVNEIKEVSRSYKEAKMAMEVGKIFSDGRRIIAYHQLGIGRLIYQLPIPLCKIFIREIFDGKNPDDIEKETLATIARFFENSLNISETSRQLFIHRNTLVYRLEKVHKFTGLDLRDFDDAVTFQIVMMVVKYMRYMESFDY